MTTLITKGIPVITHKGIAVPTTTQEKIIIRDSNHSGYKFI